jgi:hypothetical protein
MWYAPALSDTLMQPGGDSPDTVVPSDDGISCSIAQLAALFATTPPFMYGLKPTKAKTDAYVQAEYFEQITNNAELQFSALPDIYLYCSTTRLLLREMKRFMPHEPVNMAYKPVVNFLNEQQEWKDGIVPGHRTIRRVTGQAVARTCNAGPSATGLSVFQEHTRGVQAMLERLV